VRQYQRAVESHPTAMIWWGKQYLGQRDRFEHTSAEAAALVPPVTSQRTQVLVLLPDNGRARGLETVSLIDVVHKYGLYPVRCSEPDEAAQGGAVRQPPVPGTEAAG
jgi:hypothetical protein